ncbi:MAG: elongation factor Ts [bacterium]|nr:elongation factor Ts [bacterium]
MADIEQIKILREETSAPVNECRKALDEAQGNIEKAKEILKKWGKTLAEKKIDREAKEGIIDVYLHPNKKMGVILELRCESDFVAKSEDFQKLAHELCLQITAANPLCVTESDLPSEFIENEKKMYREQFANSGKPEQIVESIIEGKWQKKKEEICLLDQVWIKDDTKKIKDLVTDAIAKLGENIIVKGLKRLSIN